MASRAAGVAMVAIIVTGCAKRPGRTPAPAGRTGGEQRRGRRAARRAPARRAAGGGRRDLHGRGDKGTVNMMINQWVGAEANVAVAQCLLQQMGYTVKTSTLAEQVAWQGFDTGEVDVDPRELGPPRPREAVHQGHEGGRRTTARTGVTGIIGWYVPGWMVDKYPDITDWHNLNKYADHVQDDRIR